MTRVWLPMARSWSRGRGWMLGLATLVVAPPLLASRADPTLPPPSGVTPAHVTSDGPASRIAWEDLLRPEDALMLSFGQGRAGRDLAYVRPGGRDGPSLRLARRRLVTVSVGELAVGLGLGVDLVRSPIASHVLYGPLDAPPFEALSLQPVVYLPSAWAWAASDDVVTPFVLGGGALLGGVVLRGLVHP